MCFPAAQSADVMVIHDDDSSRNSDSNDSIMSSGSDDSMVSIDSSLSSVVSVDTDSSIHAGSSPSYSGSTDESGEEFDDYVWLFSRGLEYEMD